MPAAGASAAGRVTDSRFTTAVTPGLGTNDAPTSQSARKRAVTRAVKEVAHYLGNTPTVCRASYVDPRVIDLWSTKTPILSARDRV